MVRHIFDKRPMRVRLEKSGIMARIRNRCMLVSFAVVIWWLVFVHRYVEEGRSSLKHQSQNGNSPILRQQQRHTDTLKSSFLTFPEKFTTRDALSQVDSKGAEDFGRSRDDMCAGRYIYLYDLPKEFNEKLLEDCESLTLWADMCKETVHMGFGQPMIDPEGVFSGSGWYSTNQFNLEVIFHHRMRHYDCLTRDSSKANALFVPFYAGFEVMPHLWDGANISHRDTVPLALVNWMTSRPEWSRMDGHDHFMIAGRVTWDFRRKTDEEDDWGNKLLIVDAVMNVTTLTIEASPWHSNDVGIPYPTYFHPSSDAEVFVWQERVRTVKRNSLFCFAGAPRPDQDSSIRGQIMSHCKASQYCNLMECEKTAGKCHSPTNVMKLFQHSQFCLQPAGDSYTRRSVFDSILAGCIPVFFHAYTAYTQYGWHFPADHSSYSVFINEEFVRSKNVSIEEVLLRFSPQDIEDMRNVVISLIPRIIYASPSNNLSSKDAFELSIEGVIERAREYQRSVFEKEAQDKVQNSEAARKNREAKLRLDSLLASVVQNR